MEQWSENAIAVPRARFSPRKTTSTGLLSRPGVRSISAPIRPPVRSLRAVPERVSIKNTGIVREWRFAHPHEQRKAERERSGTDRFRVRVRHPRNSLRCEGPDQCATRPPRKTYASSRTAIEQAGRSVDRVIGQIKVRPVVQGSNRNPAPSMSAANGQAVGVIDAANLRVPPLVSGPSRRRESGPQSAQVLRLVTWVAVSGRVGDSPPALARPFATSNSTRVGVRTGTR